MKKGTNNTSHKAEEHKPTNYPQALKEAQQKNKQSKKETMGTKRRMVNIYFLWIIANCFAEFLKNY